MRKSWEAWHRGLPALSGPEPQKESENSLKGCPGASGLGELQGPQRVRSCAKDFVGVSAFLNYCSDKGPWEP